jgi:fructose-bisphosphate aldolase, class I
MARLFGVSGNLLNVAVDHGMFGELGFLRGIERMSSAVARVAEAGPDAIQLTAGQARHLQSILGRDRPALVLRLDTSNVYGTELPQHLSSLASPTSVEEAVRLDAACVVLNLFDIPGRHELRDACIRNILEVHADCHRFGMPLMVEPLAARPSVGNGYEVNGDIDAILPLARQAVELGADILKVDPTDDLSVFHQVVEVADIPVLVRGGSKVSEAELLERTRTVIDQGARGVVYGRNILQHEDPPRLVGKIMRIIHGTEDGKGPN